MFKRKHLEKNFDFFSDIWHSKSRRELGKIIKEARPFQQRALILLIDSVYRGKIPAKKSAVKVLKKCRKKALLKRYFKNKRSLTAALATEESRQEVLTNLFPLIIPCVSNLFDSGPGPLMSKGLVERTEAVIADQK